MVAAAIAIGVVPLLWVGLRLRHAYWVRKALFASLLEQGRREAQGPYDRDIRLLAVQQRVQRHLSAKRVPVPRDLEARVRQALRW